MARKRRNVDVKALLERYARGMSGFQPMTPAKSDDYAEKMRQWMVTEKEMVMLLYSAAALIEERFIDNISDVYPAGAAHPVPSLSATYANVWNFENRPRAAADIEKGQGFPGREIEKENYGRNPPSI